MIWPTVGLCLVFLLQCDAANSVKAESIGVGLRRIDKYLAREHPNDLQPDKAIELAKKWLESEREEKDKPVEALKMFVSLAKLDDQTSCNAEGLKIIAKYDSAVKNFKDRRAMTQIVGSYYLLRHAKICLKKYHHSLYIVMSTLDKTDVEIVENFVNRIVTKERGHSMKDNLIHLSASGLQLELIKKIKRPRRLKTRAIHMKDVLIALVNSHELPHDLEGLEKIFDEFIYKPCERFVQALGPDVYDPLMRDYETLLSLPEIRWRKLFMDPQLFRIDYYCRLSYVKFCRVYHEGMDKVDILKSMLEV